MLADEGREDENSDLLSLLIIIECLVRTLVFGQTGRTKGPLLFFLGSVLLWAYPMYFLRVSLNINIIIITIFLLNISSFIICSDLKTALLNVIDKKA